MSIKLYVGNLSYQVTEKDLEEYFQGQGKVLSAFVIKDKFSGQSKGFGFVEMEDSTDGQKAIKELNGKELQGRSIVVNEARPKEERPERQNFGNNNRQRY